MMKTKKKRWEKRFHFIKISPLMTPSLLPFLYSCGPAQVIAPPLMTFYALAGGVHKARTCCARTAQERELLNRKVNQCWKGLKFHFQTMYPLLGTVKALEKSAK